MPRFFLSADRWDQPEWELDAEESLHCLKVLRLNPGDPCDVFDGNGRHATTTLSRKLGKSAILAPAPVSTDSPPSPALVLGQAIPKGSNMDWIIQKAVELGVSEIFPLVTAHTIARPAEAAKKQEKWQRTALEACKQCGQNYLPRVHPPQPLESWLASRPSGPSHPRFAAALTPDAIPLRSALEPALPAATSVTWLVGPEGDLSAAEYSAAFASGFVPVSLGNIVLRVETATFFCLAAARAFLS